MTTSWYSTPSVSAMMNATAPITGGMICPPIDAVASTPPANAARYPKRFISGMVNCPVVTTLATPDPEIVPISPDEITATLAAPPSLWPTSPSDTSEKSRIIPARSRKLPNRMKRKM